MAEQLAFPYVAQTRTLTANKDEGNKLFSAGDYAAAAECYSKGLAAAAGAPDARWAYWQYAQPMSLHVVEHADVLNILRNNRAACYLKLGRYLEAAEDAHIAAESIRGMWHDGYDSKPAYEHRFRRLGKGDDIHLKGRLRASRAFAAMGNSGRALEELEWLECHRTFVLLGLNPPLACLTANPHSLPQDVTAELKNLRLCVHPNMDAVQSTKVDWRGCVAGTWRAVTTKGVSPLPLNSASATYHNGKVFLFGGGNPNMFTHNGSMWVLELSTYTWRSGGMRGLSSTKEEAVHFEEPATVVWQGNAYFYAGGTTVLQYDLTHEAWQVRQSSWPKQGLMGIGFSAKGSEGKLLDFAAVAACGKMYLYGGGIRAQHEPLGHLVALDLTTFKWEVLYNSASITSANAPEGRHCHYMWEADDKLWIFGGRIDRHPATEDFTFTQDRLLYSWDLNTNTWSHTGRMSPGNSTTGNPPCGRSEVALAVATKPDGTSLTAIFGGYTTFMKHQPDAADDHLMHGFQYLADTFVFDASARRWSLVHCDSWPSHRAGASMVYIPDEPGIAGSSKGSKGVTSNGSSSSKGGSGGSSRVSDAGGKRSKGLVPGRFLMLGGYLGGSSCLSNSSDPDPDGPTVWELKLDAHPKRVKAVCHGCGKFDVGMKQCTGSCGGAVTVCSPECHKTVWDSGHRLWCKKKVSSGSQSADAPAGADG